MNVLDNAFTARWQGAEAELGDDLAAVRAQYQQAVADEDYTIASVIVGQAAGLINATEPAGAIVTTMVSQAIALLGSAG
jgi:nitronate monooxygenase